MKLNVVLAGLGFGGCFVRIYKDHPDVGSIGIFDTNKALMEKMAGEWGVDSTYDCFEDILNSPDVDAVHLVTPIPLHEEQTVAVLDAGKHCACTVPMATSLDGIRRIAEAAGRSRKNYMMMETTLYTYQFFYVSQMLKSGELGHIQFMRGSHYQDMTNWPAYWMGLPPMWYGTHAIGPMAALSGSRICKVACFGSGRMDKSLSVQYGNPFPVESAILAFENGLKAEATRSLFETAREYQEGFFVYGSKASFEWGFREGDEPYLTTLGEETGDWRGRHMSTRQIELPNYADSLPEPIRRYTVADDMFDPLNPHLSLSKGKGGGHHGSHPHLVNEFVMSILEGRKPWIDETLGGNITAAGICAHDSAMRDGQMTEVPTFG